MDWNVIVTVVAGPGHEHRLLDALAGFGRFRPTAYRYVCMGTVADRERFLEAVEAARAAGKPWAAYVARIIPVDSVMSFRPETLAAQLKEAVAPLVARMSTGSFCVRVERRGLAGRVSTRDVEREVAEHVDALATAQGKSLRADLDDPDFLIAGETLGNECGVGLLTRAMRQRYPFVAAR